MMYEDIEHGPISAWLVEARLAEPDNKSPGDVLADAHLVFQLRVRDAQQIMALMGELITLTVTERRLTRVVEGEGPAQEGVTHDDTLR
jgi:hypothetical protein